VTAVAFGVLSVALPLLRRTEIAHQTWWLWTAGAGYAVLPWWGAALSASGERCSRVSDAWVGWRSGRPSRRRSGR